MTFCLASIICPCRQHRAAKHRLHHHLINRRRGIIVVAERAAVRTPRRTVATKPSRRKNHTGIGRNGLELVNPEIDTSNKLHRPMSCVGKKSLFSAEAQLHQAKPRMIRRPLFAFSLDEIKSRNTGTPLTRLVATSFDERIISERKKFLENIHPTEFVCQRFRDGSGKNSFPMLGEGIGVPLIPPSIHSKCLFTIVAFISFALFIIRRNVGSAILLRIRSQFIALCLAMFIVIR